MDIEADEELSPYQKYYRDNKEKVDNKNKSWAERNQERLKEYRKEYYQKNKEKILARQKEREIDRAEYNKEWRKNNPEKHEKTRRKAWLKREYGLTPEEYDIILEKQGGVCAICGTDEPGNRFRYMSVDHCHDSEKIRGLLCHYCNVGIGNMRDDVEILKSAIKYLEESGE